jgi:hypothetical protein
VSPVFANESRGDAEKRRTKGASHDRRFEPAFLRANQPCAVTSHYGFHVTQLYVVFALSGQQTNMPAGQLSFAPVLPPPYTLPVLLYGTTGTLSRSAAGNVTLSLAFGSLSLPAGGLCVSGSVYPSAVSISQGQSVSWAA